MTDMVAAGLRIAQWNSVRQNSRVALPAVRDSAQITPMRSDRPFVGASGVTMLRAVQRQADAADALEIGLRDCRCRG